MYLKSIDELPAPFPLPAFITFHSLSIPSVAFHYPSSPFITFHRRPISLSAHSLLPRFVLTLTRFVLASPRFVLASPRFVLALTRFVLTLPRFVLTSPRFVLTSPHSLTIPPLHTCFPPASSPPLCFTHPSFTHHCLRPFVYSLHCFTPLCFAPSIVLYPLCFTLSRCFASFVLLPPPFALFTPVVLHPFFYSPPTSANTSPAPQKATFFSFFKEILQKPLTKQKKVLY